MFPSVAGVQTPAFVERTTCATPSPPARRRVAGVQTPAFVERAMTRAPARRANGCVAGVQTPAFVERLPGASRGAAKMRVSPGFRLRPSLSGARERRMRVDLPVSPGFRLRPSLSVDPQRGPRGERGRVSPGFRLRPSLSVKGRVHAATPSTGVAGVQTPAFVERWRRPPCSGGSGRCRRGSDSGLR